LGFVVTFPVRGVLELKFSVLTHLLTSIESGVRGVEP
jgi:hypothetical protein